jgi:hypothetical protein
VQWARSSGSTASTFANFALGRSAEGAIGVVSVDDADRVTASGHGRVVRRSARSGSAQVVTLD